MSDLSLEEMRVCSGPCRVVLVCVSLLMVVVRPLAAWDADLELLDLVEEIPQSFYEFMSLNQVRTHCHHGNR